MNSADFRKELLAVMPGYKWTIHKSSNPTRYLAATGTKSSGYNRLSTLHIVRSENDGTARYEAKLAGYGTKSPIECDTCGGTLKRALRRLQSSCEQKERHFGHLANQIQTARSSTLEPSN